MARHLVRGWVEAGVLTLGYEATDATLSSTSISQPVGVAREAFGLLG